MVPITNAIRTLDSDSDDLGMEQSRVQALGPVSSPFSPSAPSGTTTARPTTPGPSATPQPLPPPKVRREPDSGFGSEWD